MSGLTENAKRVLEALYLKRGANGQVVESPGQLFERVARAVSEAEMLHGTAVEARLWEERFYNVLANLDFLPNSPTLMNAGTPLSQLSDVVNALPWPGLQRWLRRISLPAGKASA